MSQEPARTWVSYEAAERRELAAKHRKADAEQAVRDTMSLTLQGDYRAASEAARKAERLLHELWVKG